MSESVKVKDLMNKLKKLDQDKEISILDSYEGKHYDIVIKDSINNDYEEEYEML